MREIYTYLGVQHPQDVHQEQKVHLNRLTILICPKYDHCLVLLHVVTDSIFLLLDLSKLLHGFIKIDTWISLWRSCCMDLSKLVHVFLEVVTWICQNGLTNVKI